MEDPELVKQARQRAQEIPEIKNSSIYRDVYDNLEDITKTSKNDAADPTFKISLADTHSSYENYENLLAELDQVAQHFDVAYHLIFRRDTFEIKLEAEIFYQEVYDKSNYQEALDVLDNLKDHWQEFKSNYRLSDVLDNVQSILFIVGFILVFDKGWLIGVVVFAIMIVSFFVKDHINHVFDRQHHVVDR